MMKVPDNQKILSVIFRRRRIFFSYSRAGVIFIILMITAAMFASSLND
jgi:hypothetical protein